VRDRVRFDDVLRRGGARGRRSTLLTAHGFDASGRTAAALHPGRPAARRRTLRRTPPPRPRSGPRWPAATTSAGRSPPRSAACRGCAGGPRSPAPPPPAAPAPPPRCPAPARPAPPACTVQRYAPAQAAPPRPAMPPGRARPRPVRSAVVPRHESIGIPRPAAADRGERHVLPVAGLPARSALSRQEVTGFTVTSPECHVGSEKVAVNERRTPQLPERSPGAFFFTR